MPVNIQKRSSITVVFYTKSIQTKYTQHRPVSNGILCRTHIGSSTENYRQRPDACVRYCLVFIWTRLL